MVDGFMELKTERLKDRMTARLMVSGVGLQA